MEPLLLVLPETLVQAEPIVTFQGLSLPTMTKFVSEKGTWIVYLDPSRVTGPLSMNVASDSSAGVELILLPVIVVLLAVSLSAYLYFVKLRLRNIQ
jgi:hypothetical protein